METQKQNKKKTFSFRLSREEIIKAYECLNTCPETKGFIFENIESINKKELKQEMRKAFRGTF